MTEAEIEQRNKEQCYSRLFEGEMGKKVLADLEKFCGYNDSSVCEQAPDAMRTMYCEGKRRVFLRIKSLMKKGKENE